MKIAIAGAAFLFASTAANAQDLVPGQVLWGGIKTGMTKAEVKAMYPGMVVQLTDGCMASISLTYQHRGVETVKLEQDVRSTSKSCGSVMLASLKEKYGPPRSDRNQTQFVSTSCYGKFACALRDAALAIDPDPNIYWQVVNWFTGNMLVELYRDRETDNWHIAYYQAHRAQPEAASKL
jgi:hypothetical protein